MSLVKMRARGQITLPADLCREIKIDAGDIVKVTVENGVIKVTPMKLVERKRAA